MRARLLPLAVLVVLAAGCSGGGDGEASPTLPPITEAPSESPSAAAVPSEATAATPEGAAEFIRFWFDTLNTAASTGDTRRLEAISDPACETCDRFIDSINSLYDPGGRIEGGQFTVTAVEAMDVDPAASEARAFVLYDVTATRQVAPDGTTVQDVEALTGESGDLVLLRTTDGWTLREFA